MIESKYNYYAPQGESILCLNGVSGAIISLHRDDFFFMKKLMYDKGLQGKFPDLCAKLIKTRFLVDSRENEITYLKEKNRKIQENGVWHLIINPTQNCNFHCWYCYEKHPQGKMEIKTINSVKCLIKNILHKDGVKRLIVGWFGGEPLLYFNEVVYPISAYAKDLAERLGIDYSFTMTTNGFLFKDSIIQKCNEIRLNDFQITLDGNREMHNKVRNQNGKPSFDQILNNCIALLQSDVQIGIQLRINYTTDSIQEDYVRLLECIPADIRNQIRVQFQRVWQTYESEGDNNKVNELLNLHLKKLRENGFRVSFNTYYNIFRGILCYADRKNYLHINYDGHIYRCTARDYLLKNALGHLNEKGDVEWKDKESSEIGNQAFFDNSLCLSCKYLPICGGPCFSKWTEVFKGRQLYDCPLNKIKSDLTLSDFIKNYYIEYKIQKELVKRKNDY